MFAGTASPDTCDLWTSVDERMAPLLRVLGSYVGPNALGATREAAPGDQSLLQPH